MSLGRLMVFVLLIWVFLKTVSYGKWTWDKKNKFGAIMVYILALTALILPIYSMYFRD
ncbi:MAG: hypothetical protein ACOYWZ_15815 [Bacillota bacterium]